MVLYVSLYTTCWKYVRLVHIGSRNSPSFVTLIHKRHHLIVAIHDKLRQILDIGAQTWMFSNTQVAGILGVEEVSYFLVVDLEGIQRYVYQINANYSPQYRRPQR